MAKDKFSKVQKEQYDLLPEKAKKDVDDGYGVVVCDLETRRTIANCVATIKKLCGSAKKERF